jgi:hypothetical protein
MRAHIWLGLLSVPLLILHSGFYFQNTEATILLALFLVVIASGVWGLVMQQFLPQKMLDQVPAETIYSQIEHVSGLLVLEAERLVVETCGTTTAEAGAEPNNVPGEVKEAILASAAARTHFAVGAVRAIGGLQGKVLETRPAVQYVPGSEPLREFGRQVIAYLKGGTATGSPLASSGRARVLFNELRMKLDPRAHEIVDALENLCEQRRQFDLQARLHFWLHNWLWVHLPLSVALIALMVVHIFMTLRYWWPS